MRALIWDGEHVTQSVEWPEVESALARSATVWVDLISPEEDTAETLTRVFELHPLTVTDLWDDCAVPKIEEYGNYLQLLVHGATSKGGADMTLEPVELDLIIGARFLVTHAKDRGIVDCVRTLVLRNPRAMSRGVSWLAHSLLDELVSNIGPLLDVYETEIQAIEAELFQSLRGHRPERQLKRIFTLKRALSELKRMTNHQRDLLLRLARGEFDEVPQDALPFFRDVSDHFARIINEVDAARELLTSLFDAHLSLQSNRLNEVMKTLTLMSTVMLPLTFIAGVYGMNFDWMPELKLRYGYPGALLLMTVTAVCILGWFRRKKWL